MTTRETCPICGSSSLDEVLNAKDHTVSGEGFGIVKCRECGFHFTNPVPDEEKIGDYYKSEDYVSHTDTRRGVINRMYHVVRERSIRKKEKLIANLTTGRNLLDVGCGTGEFLAYCISKNWSAVGLEPDDGARQLAREKGVDAKDISTLEKLENESFDIITMWHVLEHVWNLNKQVDSIVSKIRPGGYLIVAVPNRLSRDAKWYGENWAAWDVPRHLYHFTPKDIRTLSEKHGLVFERMIPMKYDAYYVSMLSEKIRGGNLLKAAWNGWRSNVLAKNGEYSSQVYVLRRQEAH